MSIGTSFEDTFGLRPDLYEPYQDFVGLFWQRRLVDPVVLELSRRRVATLLRCTPALGERTSGVSELPESDAFTAAQRAAVDYAEQFVIDPHGVDDDMRARVREHLSSAEFVALTEALAVFDGFTRFRLALCDEDTTHRVVDPPPVSKQPLEIPADADPALTGSVLGEQPETLVAFLRLYGTLWSHGTVPQPLKEVARLRNARITDCGY
jgi:alkylhydroperoxidase family enzyme